jgi:hypothetical protein
MCGIYKPKGNGIKDGNTSSLTIAMMWVGLCLCRSLLADL